MSMTQLLSVNAVLLKTLDEKNTMRMIITREVAGLRDYTSCLMVWGGCLIGKLCTQEGVELLALFLRHGKRIHNIRSIAIGIHCIRHTTIIVDRRCIIHHLVCSGRPSWSVSRGIPMDFVALLYSVAHHSTMRTWRPFLSAIASISCVTLVAAALESIPWLSKLLLNFLCLSSWEARENTLLIVGKGSMSKTWPLTLF